MANLLLLLKRYWQRRRARELAVRTRLALHHPQPPDPQPAFGTADAMAYQEARHQASLVKFGTSSEGLRFRYARLGREPLQSSDARRSRRCTPRARADRDTRDPPSFLTESIAFGRRCGNAPQHLSVVIRRSLGSVEFQDEDCWMRQLSAGQHAAQLACCCPLRSCGRAGLAATSYIQCAAGAIAGRIAEEPHHCRGNFVTSPRPP